MSGIGTTAPSYQGPTDAALRAITDAVTKARREGATDTQVLERVLAPLLDLSLLGQEERRVAVVVARTLDTLRR